MAIDEQNSMTDPLPVKTAPTGTRRVARPRGTDSPSRHPRNSDKGRRLGDQVNRSRPAETDHPAAAPRKSLSSTGPRTSPHRLPR